jgi:hypothetical protein
MLQKWKRREKIAVIAVFLVIALVGAYFIFHEVSFGVDTTMDGVQYRIGDPSYVERVTIKMTGIYKSYLFKDSTFYGAIEISNKDVTKDYMASITFNGDYSYLTYYDYGKKSDKVTETGIVATPVVLGQICTAKNFKQVLITIFDEYTDQKGTGWNMKSGTVIVAPATTRTEAVQIAGKLAGGSTILRKVTSWN